LFDPNVRGLPTSGQAPSTFKQQYDQLQAELVPDAWFPIADTTPIFKSKPIFHQRLARGASETKVVQPLWSKLLRQLPKNGAVVLKNTFNKVSFGTRKPDAVGYIVNKPKNVFHIALIGEVKSRQMTDDFSKEAKGQLTSFLMELLADYQPYQDQVTGFLTDSYLIQFFKLSRAKPLFRLIEGPVLLLHEDGGRWLVGFLQAAHPAARLFDIKIKGKPVIVGNLLGLGGSSVVHEGSYQGNLIVPPPVPSIDCEHGDHHFDHIYLDPDRQNGPGGQAI
jgi:hypothetical protein